ncbi:nitrite reductase small subunit NirD [Brachybacterium aquaticum]|uniref:Nitrite reductase (NADH) small subunit n=1 Tax=Brachybacterium aquaticum TaxID=1432564 RepID=A0A841AHY4_9MICO|nr:nitrite reductase small subunit NirD [Brachybacterium aquaticum]MBB5832872.1 nitrite reductase (NADH) small subunit [Brachybacterium aquaticum]
MTTTHSSDMHLAVPHTTPGARRHRAVPKALPRAIAANWVKLCPLTDLEVERGRAALVDGEQVALFLLADGDVRAVDNHDPYSGANVISRGIVGSRGDRPTVASPMYKQIFDLRSGTCVDTQGKEFRRLRVWPVRTLDGDLYLLRGGAR